MILIGEKINGSIPAVAQAIRDKDDSVILERARLQAAAGADYLDVCASVSVETEGETLRHLIDLVQSVTDIPLSIDSPNPHALVEAMAYCLRPGLINSVSMEGQKADVVFPAISGTPWRCIALLSDDQGIPETVEGRLRVLEALMSKAQAYHIPEEHLFIDPLVVTLSTTPQALQTFAACCKEIHIRYPKVHITSGLSNISFGLPGRKYLNQAFLILARSAGMDSAILDPSNMDLRNLLSAAEALLGEDPFCRAYIHRFTPREEPAVIQKEGPLTAVRSAVEQGRFQQIEQAVTAALQSGIAPGSILNDGMIPAMDALGEQFSKGTAFVPQLLMAARAMKKGVALLKPLLGAESVSGLGRVIIGTVAGDQHDIGKNLVAMMLESAGFAVTDLGADVSPERFIEAVNDNEDTRIVALSALLTTTMPAMQETVRALNGLKHRRKFFIMVGGAPITQDFATSIGADGYSGDGAAAVQKAKALVMDQPQGG